MRLVVRLLLRAFQVVALHLQNLHLHLLAQLAKERVIIYSYTPRAQVIFTDFRMII